MSRVVSPQDAATALHRREVHTRQPWGQSSTEYLVVFALLALALVVGPDSPLEQVFRAFALRYQQFIFAMSRP